MSINNFVSGFSTEQQPTLQYLLGNWKSLLVELPLYSNSFQLLLASRGVVIPLELLEDLLLELKKLIPNYVLLRKYNAKVPGCSQMVVDYFNFELLDNNKFVLDTSKSEYKNFKALLDDDSSYFKDQKKVFKDLLHEPTSLQVITKENALSEPAVPFIDSCRLSTRECAKSGNGPCKKIHFQSIIRNNTDVSLGDCSYLNTCFKGKNCRYVHYQISIPDCVNVVDTKTIPKSIVSLDERVSRIGDLPAQWMNCDIKKLNFNLLGDFAAVFADPPWDIHTNGHSHSSSDGFSDSEMLELNLANLQSNGFFFLWVTGRAIDIGRQCLKKWGYTHIEELIWCKTNQLGRTICTGRTGHWLNHSKEHVLMGAKGDLKWVTKKLDVDVIVSGTREKSHKPDELYDIAERLVGKSSRKLELFGTTRNIRPRWLTIGNQLESSYIEEPFLRRNFPELTQNA